MVTTPNTLNDIYKYIIGLANADRSSIVILQLIYYLQLVFLLIVTKGVTSAADNYYARINRVKNWHDFE